MSFDASPFDHLRFLLDGAIGEWRAI